MSVLSAVMCWIGCYLILCRIDKMMKGVTRNSVFAQHAFLGACLFVGGGVQLTEFRQASSGIVALGVVVFFIVSRARWRTSAPEGTEKPKELMLDELRQVHGGKG